MVIRIRKFSDGTTILMGNRYFTPIDGVMSTTGFWTSSVEETL